VLKANSSQSLLMSFAYIATPSGKESFQLFGVIVAMFLACRVAEREVLLV